MLILRYAVICLSLCVVIFSTNELLALQDDGQKGLPPVESTNPGANPVLFDTDYDEKCENTNVCRTTFNACVVDLTDCDKCSRAYMNQACFFWEIDPCWQYEEGTLTDCGNFTRGLCWGFACTNQAVIGRCRRLTCLS